MALDKRTREQMLAHCGEIHEDDGVDPREYLKLNTTTRKKEDHKAKRICRQVAETLDQVLSGETGDDILRNLRVESVVPAPDSSRLFVTLRPRLVSGGVRSQRRRTEARQLHRTSALRSCRSDYASQDARLIFPRHSPRLFVYPRTSTMTVPRKTQPRRPGREHLYRSNIGITT